MRYRIAARTDVGRRREVNEDFFAVDEQVGLFVVADGLGGHVAGRTASETAVGSFLDQLRKALDGPASERLPVFAQLRKGCRIAHEAILERTRVEPELRGMGTTLAALWLREDRAALLHVGDSRIYVLRDGKLHGLTFDHSLVREMVFRKRLSWEQARTHPYRHVITRALGVGGSYDPDTAEFAVEDGDLFVLCTDGVTAQISDEEIGQLLLGCGPELERAADELVDLANERGGEDNATVVLVGVRAPD